jgi:hypothetical protein
MCIFSFLIEKLEIDKYETPFNNHPILQNNKEEWIYTAIEKTIAKIAKVGLDISIVSYLSPKPIIEQMIQRILAQIS